MVVRDIHAALTLATSCILHTGTAPAEAAEAAVSFPAPAPSTAIFCDAVSPTPEPYHRKLGGCCGFLMQCSLAFFRSPRFFPDDTVKLSYVVGLLSGKVLPWAEAFFMFRPIEFCPYDVFLAEQKKT